MYIIGAQETIHRSNGHGGKIRCSTCLFADVLDVLQPLEKHELVDQRRGDQGGGGGSHGFRRR